MRMSTISWCALIEYRNKKPWEFQSKNRTNDKNNDASSSRSTALHKIIGPFVCRFDVLSICLSVCLCLSDRMSLDWRDTNNFNFSTLDYSLADRQRQVVVGQRLCSIVLWMLVCLFIIQDTTWLLWMVFSNDDNKCTAIRVKIPFSFSFSTIILFNPSPFFFSVEYEYILLVPRVAWLAAAGCNNISTGQLAA